MAELTHSLKNVPLFAGLSDRDLERLGSRMRQRRFDQGDTIVTEGEGGVGFFIIDDGTATVSVGGESVRTLGPGDYFGEMALIDGGRRSATIVADTELVCRGMTAWEFRPLVQGDPDIAWPLIEALVARLRQAEQRG